MTTRFGIGYDVHKMQEGRALILGGVKVDFHKGLAGHSDADVLMHALIDALLGAAGLRDIGFHFPDSDKKYQDIDSTLLLKEVLLKINSKGFEVNNVDMTIVCQKPNLFAYIPLMIKKIAEAMCILEERVNVKATTTEGLGFTGREEGIAALAVASIQEINR